MNTFPEKRARLRIPPPLCVGTLRKHAGGLFLVPTAAAMPRGGNREGRGARFFAALRMTGRGTRPAGDEGRAEQSPAPTVLYECGEGTRRGARDYQGIYGEERRGGLYGRPRDGWDAKKPRHQDDAAAFYLFSQKRPRLATPRSSVEELRRLLVIRQE